MINDILNEGYNIKIAESTYQLEFDNKAYAKVEEVTNKGLFRLYEDFVVSGNIRFEMALDILCCGLMKHHSLREIELVREKVLNLKGLLIKNWDIFVLAFMNPLISPDWQNNVKKKASVKKAKSSKKNSIG